MADPHRDVMRAVERWARRQPAAVAISDGRDSVTYGQLWAGGARGWAADPGCDAPRAVALLDGWLTGNDSPQSGRAQAERVEWYGRRFELGPGVRVAAAGGAGCAGLAVAATLAFGATLVLAGAADPARLVSFLDAERIDHAALPTALAEQLFAGAAWPATVRTIDAGATPLRPPPGFPCAVHSGIPGQQVVDAPERGGHEYASVVEDVIAGIWADVLGRWPDRVDDFAALGGGSAAAAQVTARLRGVLGVALEAPALRQHCVLREYAAEVDRLLRASEGLTPNRSAREGPLPLSYLQDVRLAEEARALRAGRPRPLELVPILVELRGDVDDERVDAALAALIRRHETLRTGFHVDPADGRVTAFHATDVPIRLQHRPLDGYAGSDRSAVAGAEQNRLMRAPLNLAEPPLWRAVLCRFHPGHAVLVLVVDRLILDERSGDTLVDELCAALDGTLPAADESRLQHADWVTWQRRRLGGAAREPLLRYWRTELAGTRPFPPLALPAPAVAPGAEPVGIRVQRGDRRGTVRDLASYSSQDPAHFRTACGPAGRAVVTVATEPAETRRLLADLDRRHASPLMAALHAVGIGWSAVTGERDLVVHLEAANRALPEFEPIVGPLAHPLPIRLQPDPAAQPALALARTRTTVLDALRHQDMPLPVLVCELQPEASGRPPARLLFRYGPDSYPDRPIRGGRVRRLAAPDHQRVGEPGVTFRARLADQRLRIEIGTDPAAVDQGFVADLARAVGTALHRLARGEPVQPAAGLATAAR